MKKIFAEISSKLKKIYWFIFRPKTRGVKCIIEHEGKVLLVKLAYAHKGWTLPGGGVEKDETFKEAVKREVVEEVGIDIENPEMIYEYLSTKYYKRDRVQVFYAKAGNSNTKPDGFEIEEYLWFDIKDSLPTPHSARLPSWVEKFKQKRGF